MRRIFLLTAAAAFLLAFTLWGQEDPARRAALRGLVERAESGDAKALYDLAVLHDTGYDSIPVDSVRSTVLYRLSAQKGYGPAQNYLGFRYFNGESVRQDVDSALYWLAKAAGNGDIKAANNLGFLLANSEYVTKDYPQALMWLGRAADAGLPSAKANLADMLRQGLGTAPDTIRATQLYTEAIAEGLHDAELKLLSMMGPKWETLPSDSAFTLGKFYYLRGAPVIGVTLFENAAKDGNAQAETLLGDAYSRGIGVEYSHSQSLEHFLRGAILGDATARFVIGELLDLFPDALNDAAPIEMLENAYGSPVPEDVFTAAYWYEQAAEEGVKTAEDAYDRILIP